MNTRRWYRGIAPIYDLCCRPLYAGPRSAGIAALGLTDGQSVLDLCTGTGLNLARLARQVGPSGRVIGLDFTADMLKRARRKAQHRKLDQVRLIEADGGKFNRQNLQDQCGLTEVDALLCSFGLAVAPDWQTLFSQSSKLLRPGGRWAIVDNRPIPTGLLRWINPLLVPISNLCGYAKIQRPTWELLKGYEKTSLQSHLGGFVFVAAGTKAAY